MAYYTAPGHIFVGVNALTEAEPYIKQLGTKAMIVTGKHIGKSPMYEKLTESLKNIEVNYVTYNEIIGEPTDTMIEEGVLLYKKEQCDFCIGIGGGSPLDSAKAIAAMVVHEGKISDYIGKPMVKEIPPVVEIPTTSGTGSEVTMFTVITDKKNKIKMLLKGTALVPTMAIIDPEFSIDMPRSITASTGLDALTHAVEAYTSKKAFSMTDTLAISAVKRIMKYLPIAYKNGYDTKAREEMSIAALEAGICINNSSVTIVHGMSRPIGALFHVPHGISNAIFLKECLEYALDGAYERFAILGYETGVASREATVEEASHKFLESIEELCTLCEVPTLQSLGIQRKDYEVVIEKMSEDAIASGSPSNTRKAVTKDDCMKLYKKVYNRI